MGRMCRGNTNVSLANDDFKISFEETGKMDTNFDHMEEMNEGKYSR